jgi:hypothetical protein
MREASDQGEAPQEKVKPAKKAKAAPTQGTTAPVTPAAEAIPAPARLSNDAKQAWGQTPPAIQQAFIKAEQDMQRGVDELKGKYASIDKAIEPHQDALRQMNATAGDAVDRMFLWFKALAGSPVQSFPGLAESMGLDWEKVVAAVQQSRQQPGQQTAQGQPRSQQGAPEVPEGVRNYIGNLEQQIHRMNNQLNEVRGGFNTMQQDVQAQNEAKARDNLSIWSKDKEFFEDVRQDMAQMLQTGMVPLKNGQVDLDTAYERAIYFNPDVRAKVLAKQQQANQAAQQEAADAATTAKANQAQRARKASVSLPVGNAPGTDNRAAGKAQKKGASSVRDSLRAAIAELRDQ